MEDSLNLRDRKYAIKNVRPMLKMSYTGCPDSSLAISAQFILKMCVAAGNC